MVKISFQEYITVDFVDYIGFTVILRCLITRIKAYSHTFEGFKDNYINSSAFTVARQFSMGERIMRLFFP